MTLNEYDVVALTEEIETEHQETKQPLSLRCGQVGTVLMSFENNSYLIDFSNSNGQTYAMETISAQKLMLLFYEPATAWNTQSTGKLNVVSPVPDRTTSDS